jgi:aspartate/methionine/tyrosine aminotransferase
MQAVQTPVIAKLAALIRNHPGTISLGQGVVYYPAPVQAQNSLADALKKGVCDSYGPVEGLHALRQAIAQKLASDNDIICGEDRIIVTAGGNMAFLNAVLAIGDAGDEMILPVPYYFNHEMALRMAGLKPVPVPVDRRYQLIPDAIAAAVTLRTKAVVTVSPNNPTGAVHGEESLRAVNRLCADRGIYHISDEAYEYFIHEDKSHFSPGSIERAAQHTISLYSMSKSYGFAGWRIGYMLIPDQLREAVLKIQDTNLICPALASQYAALGALEAGKPYCLSRNPQIEANRRAMLNALARTRLLRQLPVAEGAFYLFIDLENAMDAMVLATRLIEEHGVATIPGDAFGATGCHLRIAYGALDTRTAEEGASRLVRGLDALLA